MRWFEYKMEVDDLHASDDLKAKLLAMQSQQAVSAPAAKTVTRKQPEVPAHKKALHFPSSRVWKGLAACAAFCVVAGGAATLLGTSVIGLGGAKSSGPAMLSSRSAAQFSADNSVSSYAMASAPAVADYTMNESSAAAGGADTGAAESPIFWPSFTSSPTATMGWQGAPMCRDIGMMTCGGGVIWVTAILFAGAFLSSGCTPPMNLKDMNITSDCI